MRIYNFINNYIIDKIAYYNLFLFLISDAGILFRKSETSLPVKVYMPLFTTSDVSERGEGKRYLRALTEFCWGY